MPESDRNSGRRRARRTARRLGDESGCARVGPARKAAGLLRGQHLSARQTVPGRAHGVAARAEQPHQSDSGNDGDGRTAAAEAGLHFEARRLRRARRACLTRDTEGAAAVSIRRAAEPSWPRAVAVVARESLAGACDRQSRLADDVRARNCRDQRQLRRAGCRADASAVARLAGR